MFEIPTVHFGGDTYAHAGIWGQPSSINNFCEEDYAITNYIAEFVNALTNFAYVYFALRYPQSPRKPQPRGRDFMSVALFFVGVFSFIFHATLRLDAQFGDDISMYVLAGALLQAVYTHSKSWGSASLITAIISLGIASFCCYYIYYGDFKSHIYAFSAMIHAVWPRTLYLIYFDGERSPGQTKALARRFWKAVFILVTAFVVWSIDIEKCLELRKIRRDIGLPWAWLLELHGWWHVLTALGASEYIKLVRDLTVN